MSRPLRSSTIAARIGPRPEVAQSPSSGAGIKLAMGVSALGVFAEAAFAAYSALAASLLLDISLPEPAEPV